MSRAEHDPANRTALPRYKPPVAASRSGQAAVLLALASGEALLAVLFADAIDRLVAGSDGVIMPLLAAGGIVAMAGAGWLATIWLAEDFAQTLDRPGREFRA